MSAVYGGPLVPSISIENLCNQRTAVMERIHSATKLLMEAEAIAAKAGLGFPTICSSSGYGRQLDFRLTGSYRDEKAEARFLEVAQSAVDQGGWQHLMSESGLRSLMNADTRAKWNDELSGSKPIPPLTVDNIRSTFTNLYDNRGDMFEQGVISCFKSLSWDYKTNKPFRFGKRIVLTYMRHQVMKHDGARGLGGVNMRQSDRLDDLIRVMSILDGKPEPDHRMACYQLLASQRTLDDPIPENDYIRVKSFRNGNAHVEFKRADLVERMNAIIAKHFPGALPAPR